LPASVVYLGQNRRINQRAFQLEVPKIQQWLTASVNQRLNQPQALIDFSGGQANAMHSQAQSMIGR
jgi:hypothetical protein